MIHPVFKQIAATSYTDQAGLVVSLILGLDDMGRVWQKPGAMPWSEVSNYAVEGYVITAAEALERLEEEDQT